MAAPENELALLRQSGCSVRFGAAAACEARSTASEHCAGRGPFEGGAYESPSANLNAIGSPGGVDVGR